MVRRCLYGLVIVTMVLRTQADMERKIVGGEYVNIHAAPYSVFLHMRGTEKVGEWWCGGSVLNQRLLLTAAHCVDDLEEGQMNILAGHANTEKATVLRKASSYIQHREYKKISGQCDIALVLARKNLPLSKNIQRVTIRPSFPFNATGQVTGWGISKQFADKLSIQLKKLSQKTVSLDECARYRKKAALHPGMMCVSSGHSGKYPARGDSGGAFVVQEDYQQIGLVSFTFRRKPELNIYSNVSYFYHWILLSSKKLYCA